MDPKMMAAIVAVIAILAIAAIVIFSRRRRSEHLRQHFGPEYDRTVAGRGGPAQAELELVKREKRVHSFSIKPLTPENRTRYTEQWNEVQRRFVDDPGAAVSEADALVNQVMETRGYPVADFDQRAADLSVNYPRVVENYRSARAIVQRHATGQAGTEDLRQAMVYYRSLFSELLDTPQSAATTSREVLHERAS
jgi:hypothetical protein